MKKLVKLLAETNKRLADNLKVSEICHHGLQVAEEDALKKNDFTKAKQCADGRVLLNESMGKIRFDGVIGGK